MRSRCYGWCWGLLALWAQAMAAEVPKPLLVTYQAAESPADQRQEYTVDLLRLALEKTRAEHGDYRLVPGPRMNIARALEEARLGTYENYVFFVTFQKQRLELGLDYVRFPVDLGISGYRICFVSPAAREAVAQAKSLDELRQFSIVQGVGWVDVNVLRHNGLKVVTGASYEGMFGMVASNQVDLFCRGINELEAEYRRHRHLPGLDYDRSFALVYALPRFAFTARTNRALLARLQQGMQIAYRDGSLIKLWREHYQSAVQFANLKGRRIFQLETPDLEQIDFNYQRYQFNPLRP